MRKKAMIMPWTFTITVPLIIVSIVIFTLAIIFFSVMQSKTITLSSNGINMDATLYAMLNSNDCAPNTKLPFKDVLAVAIAQGKINIDDGIALDYGGVVEGLVNVNTCISTFIDAGILPRFFYFYVDQSASATSACPDKKCFKMAVLCSDTGVCQSRNTPEQLSDAPLNTESSSYISLPNGDVAKVFLKTL